MSPNKSALGSMGPGKGRLKNASECKGYRLLDPIRWPPTDPSFGSTHAEVQKRNNHLNNGPFSEKRTSQLWANLGTSFWTICNAIN